jgi:cytochrome c oxidase subunit 2
MRWLPVAASDMAARVDVLFYSMVALTGLVALGIFALMVYFCVRYRAGSRADRTNPPPRKKWLEIGWVFTPLVIFLGIFVWAAVVYAAFYAGPPGDAMTVFVVGKQWMWKVQHPGGRREVAELHLPLGEPVELVLATEDVIHSFFVPAFRVKQDAVPGRYTSVRFTPTQAGTFELHCAEYCGTDHARMAARVIVMPKADFQRWLTESDARGMAARGFDTFRRLGCSGCHDVRSSVHAPDLHGLPGRLVHLQDGRTVVADDLYMRDSILLPKKDVVAGFEPVMPSFQGQASEEDILDLIAYLRSTPKETP